MCSGNYWEVKFGGKVTAMTPSDTCSLPFELRNVTRAPRTLENILCLTEVMGSYGMLREYLKNAMSTLKSIDKP